MSTIYAVACTVCVRSIDTARTCKGPTMMEPGFTCASHQQLINFLASHKDCSREPHIVFQDAVESDIIDYKDDTDLYPDHPIKVPMP